MKTMGKEVNIIMGNEYYMKEDGIGIEKGTPVYPEWSVSDLNDTVRVVFYDEDKTPHKITVSASVLTSKEVQCSTLGDIKEILKSLIAENKPEDKELIEFYTKKIEVETEKAVNNLDEFSKQAYNAFRNTSFDPEKRGKSIIKDYSEALREDLEEIANATEEEKENYIKGFKNKFSSWMGAKSRCASSMITGPANFPVERNRKANDSEHKRSEEMHEYRVNATKRILKNIDKRRPQHEKDNEAWLLLEKGILNSAATVVNYDLGIERMYTRALFVNSIVKKVENLANKGEVVLVGRAVDLITRLNEQNKKPIISAKHKFWTFLELAKSKVEKKEDLKNTEDKVYNYDGFKVVICYKDERIRIIHDEKPERSVIDNIKSHGFKWSPFNTAWQRKITNNALYVTFKLLLKDFELVK